jgi:ABC-type proline/glycine betaine transport system ATPase subunit
VIEFVNASKSFGDVVALKDFSAVVPSGTITVLMGLSGSGKTTAVRMVNKMVIPSTGSVFIDGVDVASQNAVALRRSIGYVMQDIGLLPHKTVLDNVALIATIAGQSRETAQRNAREMLTLVGIEASSFGRFPSQLSGGQQQMLAIGRGLMSQPKLLMVDELSLGLAPILVEQLLPVLRTFAQTTGAGVLIVEQHVHLALAVSDRAYLLRRGKATLSGSSAELSADPDLVEAGYFGE